MKRRFVLAGVIFVSLTLGIVYLRRDRSPFHYTGFVEGEERVLRSEVSGRVLEVRYGEGAVVEPDAVVAVLDERDIRARIQSKQEELDVFDAEIRAQEERIRLIESTWRRGLDAQRAQLKEAEAAAHLAEKTHAREKELVQSGASTPQLLDDARARRDQAESALERARQIFARTQAEERSISLARHELETLREKRKLSLAQLGELEVTRSKYEIRAPATRTVVQTRFLWPGELAQPGSAILSVLDPADKYVQIYIPVADLDRIRVGQKVMIELDSQPGRRVAGEVSFIADRASFTPEKIETRSDRLGQVYRAKVRILEDVERFQPGTEGNVYLVEELPAAGSREKANRPEGGASG